MAAVSYSIGLGQTLEQVTPAANAPSAGTVEIRFDQTAGAVIDANAPGGTRAVKRSEVQQLMRILEEYLVKDTNIF